MQRSGLTVTPGHVWFPGAANNYLSIGAAGLAFPANATVAWRVECQRPSNTATTHRTADEPTVLEFSAAGLTASFLADDASHPSATVSYPDLEVGGFPPPGAWVQLMALWDDPSETLWLGWRAPGSDLLTDTDWNVVVIMPHPGRSVATGQTQWVLTGNTPSTPMTGSVRRWTRTVNGVLQVDANGLTDIVRVGSNLQFNVTTGQGVTRVTSGPKTVTYFETSAVASLVDVAPIIIDAGVTDDIIDLFMSPHIEVIRYCDVYEADNETPFRLQIPMLADGEVSIDMSRDERRNISVVLVDDGTVGYGPNGGLWYDKILKPYRGIALPDGTIYVTPLGEYLIDTIDRPRFPSSVMQVNGRDFTKKLKQAKFTETTTFTAVTQTIDQIIQTIALNAGITKFALTATTETLGTAITWEKDSERWAAIKNLAMSIGNEVYFDRFGRLVLRPFVDPLTATPSFDFVADEDSNLVDYNLRTSDNEMFNEVVVRGSGQTNGLVYGHAENDEPLSPTRISLIGRRTAPPIENPIVPNDAEAERIAKRILAVVGLESYDVSITSLVAPWLEAGDVISFIPTEGITDEPTSFLLTNFTIPFALGPMTAVAKRVVKYPPVEGTYGFGTYGGGTYGTPA